MFWLVLAFSMLLSSQRRPPPVGTATPLRGWRAQRINSENLEKQLKKLDRVIMLHDECGITMAGT